MCVSFLYYLFIPEKLIQKEDEDSGTFDWSVLEQYIAALGGHCVLICVLICFSLPVVGVTGAGWYLTYWIQQGGGVSG